MSDHGILFSAPMVRALLAGRKTQSRRPLYALRKGDIKRQMRALIDARYPPPSLSLADVMDHFYDLRRMYAVGDRLWVREAAWICPPRWTDTPVNPMGPDRQEVAYAADDRTGGTAEAARDYKIRLRSSIHMPRWASRLTLTVSEVRVERLTRISEEDARAEGCWFSKVSGRAADDQMAMSRGTWFVSARSWYSDLWNRINGEGAWEANPWVVAYSFTVERRNIDAEAAP